MIESCQLHKCKVISSYTCAFISYLIKTSLRLGVWLADRRPEDLCGVEVFASLAEACGDVLLTWFVINTGIYCSVFSSKILVLISNGVNGSLSFFYCYCCYNIGGRQLLSSLSSAWRYVRRGFTCNVNVMRRSFYVNYTSLGMLEFAFFCMLPALLACLPRLIWFYCWSLCFS